MERACAVDGAGREFTSARRLRNGKIELVVRGVYVDHAGRDGRVLGLHVGCHLKSVTEQHNTTSEHAVAHVQCVDHATHAIDTNKRWLHDLRDGYGCTWGAFGRIQDKRGRVAAAHLVCVGGQSGGPKL